MEVLDLSVIVPNYNNEKYVEQCIRSIVSQDYPISEIIVYDDASTDNSPLILERLESEIDILKVIYGKNNVGVSTARDTAIKTTSSEYVTMIDGDDFYYNNNKISHEMKIINESFSKGVNNVCVFSQTVKVDESGNAVQKLHYRNLDKFVRFGTVTRLMGFYTPRDYIFPKSEYLRLGGYRSDMNLYEDWELNLRLLSRCEFKYSGVFGTAYRQKEGGLSRVDGKRHLEAKIKAHVLNKDTLHYSLLENLCFYGLAYVNYLRKVVKKSIVP